MLPSNQQHNTIYRYRSLFSGAQCEASSITTEAAGDPQLHRLQPLRRLPGARLRTARRWLLRVGEDSLGLCSPELSRVLGPGWWQRPALSCPCGAQPSLD